MNPWKVSAQFAAYSWYLDHNADTPQTADEAKRFARDNWVGFLPAAHDGVGRLLIALGKSPKRTQPGGRSESRPARRPRAMAH